jgi:dihydroxy-acid dehydratase
MSGPKLRFGGPIALIEHGDMIEIDAEHGVLSLRLDDETLVARRANWRPRRHGFRSGTIR